MTATKGADRASNPCDAVNGTACGRCEPCLAASKDEWMDREARRLD